jgi:hypothetical protein
MFNRDTGSSSDGSAGRQDDRGITDSNPGQQRESSPKCLECKKSLEGRKSGTLYCSEAHSKAYRRRQERIREKKASYLSERSDMSPEDLDAALAVAESILNPPEDEDEPYEDEPDSRPRWDDIRAEYLPMIDGHNAGQGFDDYQRYEAAEEAVWARYDARIEPYRATQRRNKGVVLPQIRALEIERDKELDRLERSIRTSQQYERALRAQPMQQVTARERQNSQAALSALGNELPGWRIRAVKAASGQGEYHGRDNKSLFGF